jgi:hypothetical protein
LILNKGYPSAVIIYSLDKVFGLEKELFIDVIFIYGSEALNIFGSLGYSLSVWYFGFGFLSKL